MASFTAGPVIGTSGSELVRHTRAFAEAEGQLLSLLTFLLFGTVVVAGVLDDVSWRPVAYALVSLLVVRPLAVAIALAGSHVRPATVAFIAWAGPRGLASIVCVVLVAESENVPQRSDIFVAAAWTILLSVYLHSLTAAPLSACYGKRIERGSATHEPEHLEVTDIPTRH